MTKTTARRRSAIRSEDRYCIDIVTQIAAVRLRSRRLLKILEEHVNHCVAG